MPTEIYLVYSTVRNDNREYGAACAAQGSLWRASPCITVMLPDED
jgi:hypothetical protein